MELQTLDGSYQARYSVDGYESLIWSERYSTNGDFQMVSSDIERMINLIPLESCVRLRESTVPMIVESHQITKPINGLRKVVVKGRSFETVLERRLSTFQTVGSTIARPAWIIASGSASDAAYKAIRTIIGDPQTRSDLAPVSANVAEDSIPQINTLLPVDYVPNALNWASGTSYLLGNRVKYNNAIWEALGTTTATPSAPEWKRISDYVNFEIAPGYLYNVVVDLLNTNHHGLKAVVPAIGGNQINVEIYNGANLTDKVVFDARLDQFDNSTYLFSYQGSANTAYVYGPNGWTIVNKNTGPVKTGLDRRAVLVDGTSDTGLTSDIGKYNRGIIELYKNNVTALFDGETSVQVASLFNKSNGYFLGDIVKLVGDYGLSRNVRVAEFIRTSDSSGEKAFPTFEAIDEG
jgi:hypothetical protein